MSGLVACELARAEGKLLARTDAQELELPTYHSFFVELKLAFASETPAQARTPRHSEQ